VRFYGLGFTVNGKYSVSGNSSRRQHSRFSKVSANFADCDLDPVSPPNVQIGVHKEAILGRLFPSFRQVNTTICVQSAADIKVTCGRIIYELKLDETIYAERWILRLQGKARFSLAPKPAETWRTPSIISLVLFCARSSSSARLASISRFLQKHAEAWHQRSRKRITISCAHSSDSAALKILMDGPEEWRSKRPSFCNSLSQISGILDASTCP
jgi:hypothetical protein